MNREQELSPTRRAERTSVREGTKEEEKKERRRKKEPPEHTPRSHFSLTKAKRKLFKVCFSTLNSIFLEPVCRHKCGGGIISNQKTHDGCSMVRCFFCGACERASVRAPSTFTRSILLNIRHGPAQPKKHPKFNKKKRGFFGWKVRLGVTLLASL